MKFFNETHGPVYELTRHFLARMFDSELFSTAGRWRSAAIGAFSMLLLTGVAAFYQDPLAVVAISSPCGCIARKLSWRMLAGEAGRMMLFLAVSGLIAMLQWQALLPSRRDYLALASLPLRPWKVFAARFLAFMLFSLVAVAALNALPSLFAPFSLPRIRIGRTLLPGLWPRRWVFLRVVLHAGAAGRAAQLIAGPRVCACFGICARYLRHRVLPRRT